MRLQLIANPVAGRGATALIHQLRQRLLEAGHEVELCLTRGPGDAEKYAALAVSGGFERMVVAGGDGTINEVVNGMTADSPPLAIIPLGTTNVLALEIGLPRRFTEVCDLAVQGRPTSIHLGLAGQRRFVLMAGLGFDAAVVQGVNLRIKRALGKGAYLVSSCQCWLRPAQQSLQIVDDKGQIHHGYGAIISNARCYGGRFTMTPSASLFAESLDVCLILRPGRLALLRAGLALLTGRPLPQPWGRHFRSHRLEVTGDGVPMQIDGDAAGSLPQVFTVNPFPIRLILPKL